MLKRSMTAAAPGSRPSAPTVSSAAFVAVDGYTTGMALSPNGRRSYVASAARSRDDRGGTIAVIDTTSHTTVDVVAVDAATETLAVDAEGLVYVTDYQTNSVSVIDAGTQCAMTVTIDDAPMEGAIVIPVDQDLYAASLVVVLSSGRSTSFPFSNSRRADQCHEMGRVDRPPA